ncbi:MAG: type II toxin-antitoxin system Phd/YefM family antitoxin [Phycisphaeraceae bacterium]|nr:type II toxin-antitoxin system Phd/YefM family antitoxin [Phycisphaeraceae bacterium]
MTKMSIIEARENLSDVLNRVSYAGERVLLERRGKPTAALVSVEDMELLEALEDREDIRAAKRAIAEAKRKGEKPIPWTELKAKLGL